MSNCIIDIKDLSIEVVSKTKKKPLVNQLNLSINKGEVLAIVGESGSGKTLTVLSLLKLLPAGVIVTSGSIKYTGDEEVDVLSSTEKAMYAIRGRKIAMVFQEPMASLNPLMKCGRQIQECIVKHYRASKHKAKLEAIQWLGKMQLSEPEDAYEKYPHQLSGGQKQRVMIAMAMCCRPDVLLCDEPTTALDATVQKSILKLIKSLQQQTNMACVFVTHNLLLASEIADKVAVMHQGSIVEYNFATHIFKNPTHNYTKGLLQCLPSMNKKGSPLPVLSHSFDSDNLTKAKQPTILNEAVIASENIIEVNNLSVYFKKARGIFVKQEEIPIVKNVSFYIRRNEVLGLVGESGSGKTTLSRALMQLIPHQGGIVKYENIGLNSLSKRDLKKMRCHFQMVFQDPYGSLNPQWPIGKCIMEPMLVHKLYKTNGEYENRAIELLQKVELPKESFYKFSHQFSGGQRQRIVIARALALNPKFLVCDEAVSALDVSIQAQILNLLNHLRAEFGFSILFISHDLSVVYYFCDRIMVLKNGEMVEQGLADAIFHHPQSNYTKQLLEAIPGDDFFAHYSN